MDFEAQPLLDDEPGMYPMPMPGEAFSGPSEPEQAPPRHDATAPSHQAQASSLYQLPPATRPKVPEQEPLRTLPAPPPILDGGPALPPMRRPPQHHPGYHPAHNVPPRARMPHHPGMRGLGDDTPQSASNLLGLALVTVPVGGYVGYRYAGALGILGGMLAAGGFVNGVRAARALTSPPADSSETWVSATFAVLGLGAAAYLLYRGSSSKRHVPNKAPSASTALAHANSKHRL